jgi:glyoxylase-like metal-dependent hydrolase (beta-lactamase superfamily II)
MSDRTCSLRQFCLIAACGMVCMLAQIASGVAEAPMQKSQAPGFYRMMLGDFEITALSDGVIDLDAGLLKNVSEAEVQRLLRLAMIDDPHKVATTTNAYLVNTRAKLVLVDAGGGATFGRGLGDLRENLEAAGYEAEQVDAVLVTHLHFDHIGGLTGADGKAAFPKAVVYLSKPENDYWLSETEPDVPAVYKEAFKKARKLARDAAKPYVELSRWKTLDEGTQDLPISGITAIAIPGHTPGHTAYRIQSGKETLLIVGDMVHFAAVQFARPEAAVAFDVDPKQAAATREVVFRRVADGKTLLADMHVAFPGIGRLRSDGKSGYVFVPVEYTPLPATKPSR